MERTEILNRAKQEAHDWIDASANLSDRRLQYMRGLHWATDENIPHALAVNFCLAAAAALEREFFRGA